MVAHDVRGKCFTLAQPFELDQQAFAQVDAADAGGMKVLDDGKDIGDLTMGSLYIFATPDGSWVLNPRLDISIAQNADLVLFGGLTFGKEKEAAFPSGFASVVARATVWF